MVTRRHAVLRIRHDADTGLPAPPAELGDADVDALFSTGRYSVRRFWYESSFGNIDLRVQIMPWTSTSLATLQTTTTRQAQVDLAKELLTDQEGSDALDGFDGLVCLFYPGFWTGGTTANGTVGNACVVSEAFNSRHFLLHEVGHTLGLNDSMGLRTGLGEEQRRYGDPYDIMSAEAYGGLDPVLVVDPAAGEMGRVAPRSSQAGLLRALPGAVSGPHVEELDLPPSGMMHTVRLASSSIQAVKPQPTGATVVAVLTPQQGGAEALCLEVRSGAGFDAGIGDGADQPPAGLTVHTVGPIVGRADPHARYRGTLRAGSSDLDIEVAVAGEPYTVRLVSIEDDASSAVCEVVGKDTSPSVHIDSSVTRTLVPTPDVTVHLACGHRIRRGRFRSSTEARFVATHRGLVSDQPHGTLMPTWRVGGTVVAAGGDVSVIVGAGPFSSRLTCRTHGEELVVRTEEGASVSTTIQATMTDADGQSATRSTAFVASGIYEGVHPDDLGPWARCLESLVPRYVDILPFRFRLEDPDWRRARLGVERWRAHALRQVERLRLTDPERVGEIVDLINLQGPRA